MEPMLKMKDFPSNMGKKWTNEEELSLLEKLHTNVDIETIAQHHERTVGCIILRQRHIAYRMYLHKSSMEDIVNQTKLDIKSIEETIKRHKASHPPKKENHRESRSVFLLKKL